MSTDARTLFEDKVPKQIAANPDKAREVGAVYCFKITGEGGGTWTVDLASSPPTVRAGDSGKRLTDTASLAGSAGAAATRLQFS